MKILYCNKYNFAFSGTESYLFELMELVRSHGHETALFAMADPRGASTAYDEHFLPYADFKANGQSLFQRVRLAGRAIYSLEARRRLRGMIAAFQPDVAHVRNIYHHLSPSILWELKARGIPVIYHLNDFKLLCPTYNMVSRGRACEKCAGGSFHHVLTEGCYGGGRGASLVLAAEAYTHRSLRTYKKCVDLFLAPSQFVKNKLVENGWSGEKIEVLPHFQVLPERSGTRGSGAPVLYFGRLSLEKGVDDLLRAAHLAPEQHFQIAGDGPQRSELELLARRLSLSNVEFLGHLDTPALEARIAGSRFTVFPSHAYETFGKSILESHAFGRAVIASDLGSRRELVRDGLTGLLFPVGDVEKLAAAISLLARHPELAARMGEAGRKQVRERYSPAQHYSALNDIYTRLASQNGGVSARPSKSDVHIPLAEPERSQPLEQPPLRVAFIGGRGVLSKYSGIETYYEEVGKRLAAGGVQVTIYCRSYFTPELAEHNGMRLVRLPTVRSKHLETLVHTLLSTLHAVCTRCDIVHYHALGSALFSFLPRLFGKKTIVTVQGLDWQRKKWGRFAEAVLKLGEQASARLPNATMVVSQTLQQHYQAKYSARPAYIPNGASLRKSRKSAHDLKWGLESGKYILFLGRFSPEKNCHLLIDAYERLQTDVKLVLAGGSSHTDGYAQQLRRHQSDKILLLDWVSGPDLEALLGNAMLFVLPSDMEGLSLALLDAMGAGVCVLASDIPENCELVEDAGFTFRAGDAADLERMLSLLISNPNMRQAAARIARERVRRHYSWAEITHAVHQTYRGLMTPSNKRRARFPWLQSSHASDGVWSNRPAGQSAAPRVDRR